MLRQYHVVGILGFFLGIHCYLSSMWAASKPHVGFVTTDLAQQFVACLHERPNCVTLANYSNGTPSFPGHALHKKDLPRQQRTVQWSATRIEEPVSFCG